MYRIDDSVKRSMYILGDCSLILALLRLPSMYGAHDEVHHLFYGNACELVCLYVITTKQYFVAGMACIFLHGK